MFSSTKPIQYYYYVLHNYYILQSIDPKWIPLRPLRGAVLCPGRSVAYSSSLESSLRNMLREPHVIKKNR